MGGSVPAIPGIKAEGQLLGTMRREVAHLLQRDTISFPGAQPVSFAARHLLELQRQDYYVCEKSDGIRCLMYMTEDRGQEVTYLIDRKNDFYWVEGLHFPLQNEDVQFHSQTLVDGELVNNVLPNGSVEMNYLVFDCMVLDGTSYMHRTLDKRLAYFRDMVYNPYRALYRKYPEEIQHLPFIIEFKQMELSYGIEMMFREILPNLPHGNDGLIFTCRNTPYKFGTDEHILKWKTEDENSIDFVLTFEWPVMSPPSDDEDRTPYENYDAMPKFLLLVYHGEKDERQFAEMTVSPEEWENMKALNRPLDGLIVECYLDRENNWRFLRFRDDKMNANHISTVNSVIESIQDKVSEEDLIRHAKAIRDAWKARQAAEESKAKRAMEEHKNKAMNPSSSTATPTTSGKTKEDAEPTQTIKDQKQRAPAAVSKALHNDVAFSEAQAGRPEKAESGNHGNVKRKREDAAVGHEDVAETPGTEFKKPRYHEADTAEGDSTFSRPAPVQVSPMQASPMQASPVQASPVQASPVQASPVQASPVQTNTADFRRGSIQSLLNGEPDEEGTRAGSEVKVRGGMFETYSEDTIAEDGENYDSVHRHDETFTEAEDAADTASDSARRSGDSVDSPTTITEASH